MEFTSSLFLTCLMLEISTSITYKLRFIDMYYRAKQDDEEEVKAENNKALLLQLNERNITLLYMAKDCI